MFFSSTEFPLSNKTGRFPITLTDKLTFFFSIAWAMNGQSYHMIKLTRISSCTDAKQLTFKFTTYYLHEQSEVLSLSLYKNIGFFVSTIY